MKKKSKVCWLIYIAAFVVFLYIGYKVPYCHDEWQWGLDERIELMKNGFKDYNGRYLGNLLALLITRSVLAKAVVLQQVLCGFWMSCIKIYVSKKKAGQKKIHFYYWELFFF